MTMLNPLLLSLLLRFSVVALFGLQSSTIEARSLRPPGSGGAGGDSNVAQTEPLLSYPRPWEFTLKQDIKDGNCTLFSIRQVQQYRDLALSIPSPPIFQPKGDLHIIRYDPDPTLGIEIVKVVGYDRGKVEDKAKALCGRTELWDLYETHQQQEQVTLRLRGVDNAGVEPPPLEIEALIESGPSNNRVDLVFFSDGCTSCPLPLFYSGIPSISEDKAQGKCDRFEGRKTEIHRRRNPFGTRHLKQPNVLSCPPTSELLGSFHSE